MARNPRYPQAATSDTADLYPFALPVCCSSVWSSRRRVLDRRRGRTHRCHGPTTRSPLTGHSRQGLNLSGFQARTRGPVVHWVVCNFDLGCVVTGMVPEQQGCGRMNHRPGTLYVSVHSEAKLHPEKPSSVAGWVACCVVSPAGRWSCRAPVLECQGEGQTAIGAKLESS